MQFFLEARKLRKRRGDQEEGGNGGEEFMLCINTSIYIVSALLLTRTQEVDSADDKPKCSNSDSRTKHKYTQSCKGRGKKKSIFLGKSPKLWVGGGQES